MRILSPSNLPNLYFLALPLAVAAFGWGAGVTALAVGLGLLWKWGSGIQKFLVPPGGPPKLRFESIGVSHIVEKVRWHLDRLGVPYQEERSVTGLLGLITARSVPRLHIDAGVSSSRIGDSKQILRYLWGRYGGSHPKEAAFLAPMAESLELERRLDVYAEDVRRWRYFHALPEREYILHLAGMDDPSLPRWQRVGLRALFGVLRLFIVNGLQVNPEATRASVERAHAFLAEMEARLAEGGPLLRRGPLHSVDFQFAALCALWVVPPEFGGHPFAKHYIVPVEQCPPRVRAELEAWQARFPHCTAYTRKLYAEERAPRPLLSE